MMLARILSALSIVSIFAETQATPPESTKQQSAAQPAGKITQNDLDVVIYTSKGCSYCTSVKELFAEHNIPFTEKNVDNNRVLFKELEDKTGKRTVPQVMINGKHVGSYIDLAWGDLDEIIATAKKDMVAKRQ